MQKLTHSRVACWRDCPRKHQLRYELGLTSAQERHYLTFGTAWHHFHETGEIATDLDPFERARLTAMCEAYPFRWNYIAREEQFELPITNPETGASTPLFTNSGKNDAIVRLEDGRLAVLERKSARSVDDVYWSKLELDSQVSRYFLAARQCGYDVQTVVYDVAEKPSLKPLKATPVELRQYTKKDGRLYANQRENDETPSEFQARCAEWIKEGQHFFAREVPITEQRIAEFHAELWWQQQAIRQCQITDRWWRNTEACARYDTCEFLPICHRSDLKENTPDGYVRLMNVHPELATQGAIPAPKGVSS